MMRSLLGILLLVPFCVSGLDLDASLESLVRSQGYPFEQHSVVTEDGYILTLHRIPYGRNHTGQIGRPVLLQHGILCSSAGWLLSRPDKALGLILADQGYDVWLPNSRGNTYSRMHKNISIHSAKYWDFSFHEMGYYDLPACVDYILHNTGYSKLEYIGHSQGTTIFFVFASTRPEYNKKISYMSALAPIVFLDNMRGTLRGLNYLSAQLELFCKLTGIHEVLHDSWAVRLAEKVLCEAFSFEEKICDNIVFLIVGYDAQQWNMTLLPMIDTYMPAGTSIKQLVHFSQIAKNGGYFRNYDYGYIKNLEIYHQRIPPVYDLSKISVPVTLHYGNNDWLTGLNDIMKLNSSLPDSNTKLVPFSYFNHLDFMWAKDVDKLLYKDLLKILKTH
ncbi:lipase 3 [Halyomorpha halys]|uniref:lipase 3 n=1 Tax=Halyomorpha halys TaxID=286706 RepID=UPI0006D4D435|nr:lipase 3-like [Halyomorpha halys]